MNKRQAKKKDKNQFDAYCRNYKQRREMHRNLERAKQKRRFTVKSETLEEIPWDNW